MDDREVFPGERNELFGASWKVLKSHKREVWLANVTVRIEWLEVSQRPAGDTKDRIPSCLFTSDRYKALSTIQGKFLP